MISVGCVGRIKASVDSSEVRISSNQEKNTPDLQGTVRLQGFVTISIKVFNKKLYTNEGIIQLVLYQLSFISAYLMLNKR